MEFPCGCSISDESKSGFRQFKDGELQRIRSEYLRRAKEIPEDFYSLEHPGNLFLYTDRMRKLEDLLRSHGIFPLNEKEILDVGCGHGDWMADLSCLGAAANKLHGIDLDPGRIEKARRRHPVMDFRLGDASYLPWPDQTFDIVVQSTLFTSILDMNLKKAIAGEIVRVLKKTGKVIWYDFRVNNPYNPNVRGIERNEISSLFPGNRVDFYPVTLAPPAARILARFSLALCRFLNQFSFLRTHYFAIVQRGSSG